ncbi:MAG TPA: hypothetical protein PLE35_05335, partial [Lentisphaeria bacterium]|nr:hypothetical protein [Lentisphaeria bacterium]
MAKTEQPKIILAAEATTRTDALITGVAYSGGAFGQTWSGLPLVVDLSTLTIAAQTPLMYNHRYEPEYRLGVINCVNDGKAISFSGEIDTGKPLGAGIVNEGRKYDWQASIGADVGTIEEIEAGEKISVNGREFTGPAAIVRGAKLREVSVVAIGADSDTHIRIAAGWTTTKQGENEMENEKKNTAQATPEPQNVQAAASVDVNAAVEAALAKQRAIEAKRVADIEAAFGNDFPEIKAQALAKGWSCEQANQAIIKALRESKPALPNIMINGDHATHAATIKAAAMLSAGIESKDVIASVSEPAVEAASKRYRSGMGPKRLLLEAALANGFRDTVIDAGNLEDAINHVKANFSNVSLTGILADVYNKRLLQGFTFADQSWRQIAAIGSVSDFKQINSYRLNMLGGFEEVGAGGELKHAKLSDESYSNQAKTYGKMLGLTRQDIINDDLGALADVPFRFGRACANSFNRVFWGVFLNNSTFFASGNGNVQTSATALSVAGLEQAEQGFYAIKAADGEITGIKPAILLVPTAIG